MKGFEAALAAGADEVAIFASASESVFAAQYQLLDRREHRALPPGGARRRREQAFQCAAMSAAWSNALMKGPLRPQGCRSVAAQLKRTWLLRGQPWRHDRPRDAGGGRTGCWRRCSARLPAAMLAGHFHDTSGRALDNIAVALDRGFGSSMPRSAGLAAAPMRRAPRAMSIRWLVDRYLKARGYATGLAEEKLAAGRGLCARTLRSAA